VLAWLERAGRDQLETFYDQLAYHALQAAQVDVAITYLRLAAERALNAAANRQAIELLTQAIDLARSAGLSAVLPELLALRGRAHAGVAQWAEAGPDFQAAVDGFTADRPAERAQMLLELAEARFWTFDLDAVRRDSAEALELAKSIGRDDLVFTAMATFASVEGAQGNLLDSVALVEKAIAEYGDHLLPRSPTLGGIMYYWLARLPDAITYSHNDLLAAEGDTTRTLTGLPQLGLALAGTGRYDEAEAVFQEAQRLGRPRGDCQRGARAGPVGRVHPDTDQCEHRFAVELRPARAGRPGRGADRGRQRPGGAGRGVPRLAVAAAAGRGPRRAGPRPRRVE
jgi:tetratricopeptide (TPR) repeat protein